MKTEILCSDCSAVCPPPPAGGGAPMHASENAWYWLAGALGGAGEQPHGGDGKTLELCLEILASHVRLPLTHVTAFRDSLVTLLKDAEKKAACAAWIEEQRPRRAANARAIAALPQLLEAAQAALTVAGYEF